MSLSVDVFWSFRSPYSYLATPRLVETAKTYDVAVVVRPVYPIAVRIPGFFKTINPQFGPYLRLDTIRIAEQLGLPFRWPRPDPVIMNAATGEVPTEQPHIHRLMRLGLLACEAGRGLPMIEAVSHLIWSGTVDGWDKGDHLAKAFARAGLDLAALEAKAAREEARIDAAIRVNEEAQKKAGHWGVPLMVFEGEPFFGQDRIEALLWRLRQRGLTPRR